MRRNSNALCWAVYGGVLVASAVVVAVLVCVLPGAQHCGPPPVCAVGAPRPLYRDPIHDGAAELAECHGALHAQRRGPICLRLS